jgi:hypothetical protein
VDCESGRKLTINVCPAVRKKLCRLATAVVKTAVDRAARVRAIDDGAMLNQQVHERELNASGFRMATRRG